MAETTASKLSQLSALADKIALELVYAEVGKDAGLLPVQSLFLEFRETAGDVPSLAAVTATFEPVQACLDAVFGSGSFEPATLQPLRDWASWLQGALPSVESGQPLPPAPCLTASAPPAAQAAAAKAPEAPAPAEESLVLNLEGDAELLREFTNESQEHLQNIELGVLTLEENPTDADTLNSIFRAFHTFKGGSGFLNLRPINRLAHELESLLDRARSHKLAIDSEVINVILTGGDLLKQFVTRIEVQLGGKEVGTPILIATQPLLQRIRAVLDGTSSKLPTAPVATPVAPPVTNPAEAALVGQAPTAAPAAREGGAPAPSSSGTTVKVNTQKLDSLVDLVGEMVIAQSMVTQDPGLLGIRSQQLTRNLAQLNRITRDLQRTSMSLRMVPIRGTFQKMTRLVRDLSVKAGKQVELKLTGEETEVDRTIVEEINDPIVHMIRNSVDHGIETAEVRLAAGKPPFGTVNLRAFHQSGNIVIEIKDDGAGLNRERIHAKAVKQGLIRPDALLSEAELYNLIFAPGFSTAEKVTDISGRGVGMDVVRRNIEKLRGKVVIQSEPGRGSTFTIHLPLTLAIIDGLIVVVGEHRCIIPALSVRESFRPTSEMIATVHERAEMVNVRGSLIPLIRLHEFFGVANAMQDPTQGIVVVVESDDSLRCLLVDRLVGKQEVVIKSLGELFKGKNTLAGAAILGDGRAGLILDVGGLMRPARPGLAQAA